MALRQKVTDKTVRHIIPDSLCLLTNPRWGTQVYVQKRNEIMLEDTANGFLEGRWKWNISIDGFDDPDN